MENEHINLLSLNNYILISTKTNNIYMDENFMCYIFDKKSNANNFISSNKKNDIEVKLNKNNKAKNFCEYLYSIGFRNIIFSRNGKRIDIPVEKSTNQIKYNSPYTSAMLLRLKQTGEKKYLKGLNKSKFYTPVIIKDRKVKEHPSIKYSYASVNKNGKYYLLFSTVKEFDVWNNLQGNIWKPLEVDINNFDRIRTTNPILLDAASNKIVLTKELINIIKEI